MAFLMMLMFIQIVKGASYDSSYIENEMENKLANGDQKRKITELTNYDIFTNTDYSIDYSSIDFNNMEYNSIDNFIDLKILQMEPFSIYDYVDESKGLLGKNIKYNQPGEGDRTDLTYYDDDPIINLIPRELFRYRGLYTYIGKEYGFFVNTNYEVTVSLENKAIQGVQLNVSTGDSYDKALVEIQPTKTGFYKISAILPSNNYSNIKIGVYEDKKPESDEDPNSDPNETPPTPYGIIKKISTSTGTYNEICENEGVSCLYVYLEAGNIYFVEIKNKVGISGVKFIYEEVTQINNNFNDYEYSSSVQKGDFVLMYRCYYATKINIVANLDNTSGNSIKFFYYIIKSDGEDAFSISTNSIDNKIELGAGDKIYFGYFNNTNENGTVNLKILYVKPEILVSGEIKNGVCYYNQSIVVTIKKAVEIIKTEYKQNNGNWTEFDGVDGLILINDGTYEISVSYRYINDNSSIEQTEIILTIIIDRTPPEINLTESRYNNKLIQVTVNCTDNLNVSNNISYMYYRYNNSSSWNNFANGYTFNIAGTYYIEIIDIAGNIATKQFLIETIPPIVIETAGDGGGMIYNQTYGYMYTTYNQLNIQTIGNIPINNITGISFISGYTYETYFVFYPPNNYYSEGGYYTMQSSSVYLYNGENFYKFDTLSINQFISLVQNGCYLMYRLEGGFDYLDSIAEVYIKIQITF